MTSPHHTEKGRGLPGMQGNSRGGWFSEDCLLEWSAAPPFSMDSVEAEDVLCTICFSACACLSGKNFPPSDILFFFCVHPLQAFQLLLLLLPRVFASVTHHLFSELLEAPFKRHGEAETLPDGDVGGMFSQIWERECLSHTHTLPDGRLLVRHSGFTSGWPTFASCPSAHRL